MCYCYGNSGLIAQFLLSGSNPDPSSNTFCSVSSRCRRARLLVHFLPLILFLYSEFRVRCLLSTTGLKGEKIKNAFIPVGADNCILRITSDERSYKDWMEAIKNAIPDYDEKQKHLLGPTVPPREDSDEESTSSSEDEEEEEYVVLL